MQITYVSIEHHQCLFPCLLWFQITKQYCILTIAWASKTVNSHNKVQFDEQEYNNSKSQTKMGLI